MAIGVRRKYVGGGVNLTIVEASRRAGEDVDVPATVATGRIIDRLRQVWELPATDHHGRALSYRFEDRRTNTQLDPERSLLDGGVCENDVLHLIATTAASARGAASASAAAGAVRPSTPPAPDRRLSPSSLAPEPDDWGGYQLAAPSRTRRSASPLLLFASILAVICIGAVIAVAVGVLSGRSKKRAVTVTASTGARQSASPQPVAPSEGEASSDRAAIMGVLGGYQQAYSNHDLAGLGELFTRNIKRSGLAAGGCTVSHGAASVLASYRSQFEAGSGSYSLVGLSARQIHVDTSAEARLDANYTITPGGSGYVDFKFSEEGGKWKISEVHATCH